MPLNEKNHLSPPAAVAKETYSTLKDRVSVGREKLGPLTLTEKILINHLADKMGFSAGSITAALFLEKFVGERNWVHLDIAGTGRSEVDAGENIKGGTGFGVRLLIEWLATF